MWKGGLWASGVASTRLFPTQIIRLEGLSRPHGTLEPCSVNLILLERAVAALERYEIGPDVDPMPGVEIVPRYQIRIAARALTEERDRQHHANRHTDE